MKLNRADLTRSAQRLLWDRAAGPKEQHATCWCGRVALGVQVGLIRATDGSRARMSNVSTCGNVWTCAVCSAKVAEVRRAELLAGMAAWRAADPINRVFLLTLTFHHGPDDSLDDLERRFKLALKSLKQSSAWKKFSDAIGREGSVRSLELTYSDLNGWHPHTHELIFCRSDIAQRQIDALKVAWAAAMRRHGIMGESLTDALDHGLDIRGGDYAADYVAKFGRDVDAWCAADELTRSHAKAGARSSQAAMRDRDVHVTPFQLLAWWRSGDIAAGELFKTFARVFAGKRMLFWSPRLRKKLGIADKTDEQIAAELGRARELPGEERVASLEPEQFSIVVSREATAELLELVALLDDRTPDKQLVIDEFVAYLKTRDRRNSGRVMYRPWKMHAMKELVP